MRFKCFLAIPAVLMLTGILQAAEAQKTNNTDIPTQNWQRRAKPVLSALVTSQDWCKVVCYNPHVIRVDGLYKMWYCYAAPDYKIGYAESKDGEQWTRLDQWNTIKLSREGWDSEMQCYPFVFKHKGKEYMLYNGNDYGRLGIGYAVRG